MEIQNWDFPVVLKLIEQSRETRVYPIDTPIMFVSEKMSFPPEMMFSVAFSTTRIQG